MSADSYANCPSCGRPDVFREDYDIGMCRGEFEVSYRGECGKCGFVYKFSTKDLEPVQTAGG